MSLVCFEILIMLVECNYLYCRKRSPVKKSLAYELTDAEKQSEEVPKSVPGEHEQIMSQTNHPSADSNVNEEENEGDEGDEGNESKSEEEESSPVAVHSKRNLSPDSQEKQRRKRVRHNEQKVIKDSTEEEDLEEISISEKVFANVAKTSKTDVYEFQADDEAEDADVEVADDKDDPANTQD